MTNDDDGLLCKLCDPILIIVKDFSQDINTHIENIESNFENLDQLQKIWVARLVGL